MSVEEIPLIRRLSAGAAFPRNRVSGVIAMWLLFAAVPSQGQGVSSLKARIDGVDLDKPSVTVTICDGECNGKQLTYGIPGARLSLLRSLRNDDRVTLSADSQSVIQTIVLTGRPLDKTDRLTILGVSLVFCLVLTTLLTWWHPLKLIIGQDGRYSNSKFQMAVWFCLVIATYIGVLVLRVTNIGWDFLGGVNIPSNLLLLSGMSALTFAGAKGITTAKVDAAVSRGVLDPKPSGQPHFWKDIMQNDVGTFDLGDFQMFVVTILALGMFAVTVFHSLAILDVSKSTQLPDVDTTILASFGLGQGAYLTKKAVGDTGRS